MKRYLTTHIFAVALMLMAGCGVAMAVPARPTPFDYTLSDGSTVKVTLHGDENGSYYLSSDGYVLLSDARGDLYYATDRDGVLTATQTRADRPSREVSAVVDRIRTLDIAHRQLTESICSVSLKGVSQRKPKAVELITNYPTIGSPKALILLVEFKDVRFTIDNPHQAFENMINQKGYSYNGATGSALDYFTDNSKGLFTPEFVVMGPVTLPQNEPYYGAEEGQNRDCKGWEMVIDGCKQLRADNPDFDFSEFDNDGDGFVDNVFVFFAGRGQNDGGASWTIWPHAANIWTYYNIKLEFDGVQIGNYACTNELKGSTGSVLTGIGTFCHEYSHILGLPDIYSTNYSGSFTPGTYELMDMGSYNNEGNTPPYMSAYDRSSVGWLKVRDLTGPEDIELQSIDSNQALRIPTERDNEYYLLENRQLTGWDAHLDGHGMLIWHIEYDPQVWAQNSVNNNPQHMCVDIIEADNVPTAATRAGDPFPGTSKVTSFTYYTTPAMKTWYGGDINMPITSIRETDGVITFKIKGGGESLDPVTATEATDITATSFVATWQGRPGVASYEIDICRDRDALPMRKLTTGAGVYSVRVTGLEPNTVYRYVVRAVDGELKSVDSNEITLTTAPPTFDMLVTEALAATETTHNAFTANWNALEAAEDYELNVYAKRVIDPDVFTVDFSLSSLVPEGWYTNCNSTGALAGYFGQARPALRMLYDGAQVSTPTFDGDVNYLKFWYRAQRTSEDSRIDIEGLRGGKWEVLKTVGPLSNDAGETVEIGTENADTPIPQAVRAVRIVLHKTDASSIYLDDVEVGACGTYEPEYVTGYNGRKVGNVTSHRVEDLQPVTTYYYTVRGHNGTLASVLSDEQPVTTVAFASVGTLGADNAAGISVETQGRNVTISNSSQADQAVHVFTLQGCEVARGVCTAGRELCITLPASGLYMVRCGQTTWKVITK